MEPTTAVPRRRTIRATLGTAALLGGAGCIGTTTRPTDPNDGTADEHPTSTGGPPRQKPTRELPSFTAYLPASMKRKPTDATTGFAVYRPAAAFSLRNSRRLMEIVFEGLDTVPRGHMVPDFRRVVRGPTVVGYEGPISRGRVVRRQTAAGATVLTTYEGYELVRRARTVIAVADGVRIEASAPDVGPSRLAARVKAAIDRRERPGRSRLDALFETAMDALAPALATSVSFEPTTDAGRPNGFGYRPLEGHLGPVAFVGQSTTPVDGGLEATTALAVPSEAESYHELLATRLQQGPTRLGLFSYSAPTTTRDGGLLLVDERGSPEELLE